MDLAKPRFEIGRRVAKHGDPRAKSEPLGAIVFRKELHHAIVDCRERASWKASLVHVERRKRGIWSSLAQMRLPDRGRNRTSLKYGELMPQREDLEVQGGA